LETAKRNIRIKHATNLPPGKSLPTRAHCAAVTRALVFQKWSNGLLLRQLWQLKRTT